jgi:hypothetical protein
VHDGGGRTLDNGSSLTEFFHKAIAALTIFGLTNFHGLDKA